MTSPARADVLISSKPQSAAAAKHLILACMAVFFAILILAWLESPYSFDVDSENYIKIVDGKIAEVVRPYTERAFYPFMVRLLRDISGMSTDNSFMICATGLIGALVMSVGFMAHRHISAASIVFLFTTPFLLHLFHDYYLPDIFHAGILAVYLVCLLQKKYLPSLFLLFILAVARETTIVLAVVVVAVSAGRRQWMIVASSICVVIAGIWLEKWFSSFGRSNIHELPQLMFLLFKVPYNALKNLFGLELWTNSLAQNSPLFFDRAPLWSTRLPPWLQLGNIREVGIYSVRASFPIKTWIAWLTTFGLLPGLLFSDLARSGVRQHLIKQAPLAIAAAVAAGAISFVLGPMTGASVDRLIGYGWPLFLVGAPFMITTFHRFDDRFVFWFLFASLLVSWLGYFVRQFEPTAAAGAILACALLFAHALVWREARRSLKPGVGTDTSLDLSDFPSMRRSAQGH